LASLAPSKVEQEQRILLLAEEAINKRNQEKREYQSWRRSECEKVFSASVPLPQIKENLQAKMTKLAKDFLKDYF